ncbi:MAG TPA: LysR family transcriptional regulator [Rhizobiales bacterium]|nr:LysR family transcriptional regulator [Hyphomicrobiales bacterium]
MRFKRLDLNLLVALDHMLRLRSISRAAEQMNMSQSAMSNALTRLREYFDDPLLVQVGRRLDLTPRAQDMQDLVRDILVRVDAAISSETEFDPARSNREFSILLSDFTMQVLMPHVLRLAYAASPSIRFRLLPQQTFPYLELDRGEADLLIAPKVFSSPDHPSMALFEDEYCCLVWKGSRLADRPLTEEDFLSAGHVRMVPSTGANSFEDQFLEKRGISRRVEVNCYSFTALPYLMLGTDRIATVHGLIARHAVSHLPLVRQPLPFPWIALDEVLQWHGHRSRDSGLLWLRGIFRKAVEEMLAAPIQ